MSVEDDELRELNRLLAEHVLQAKGLDDLGVKLIDDVSSQFDNYVAKKKIADNPSNKRGAVQWLADAPAWLARQVRVLQYGPPSRDPLTRGFIGGLERSGVISRAQHRLLNLYSIVHLDPDGASVISRPSQSAYRRAAILLMLLLISSVLVGVLVWEVIADLVAGFPIAYTLGALLGYWMRGAFDYAWGRDKLAMYIKSRMPWIKMASNSV